MRFTDELEQRFRAVMRDHGCDCGAPDLIFTEGVTATDTPGGTLYEKTCFCATCTSEYTVAQNVHEWEMQQLVEHYGSLD